MTTKQRKKCLWLADRPKEEDAAARAVASIAGPSQTRVAYCDHGARSSGNVPSFQLQVGVLSVFGGESPLAESQLAASRAGGFEQKPSPRAPMGWLDHQAKEPRRTRVFCDQRRSRQRNRAFTGRNTMPRCATSQTATPWCLSQVGSERRVAATGPAPQLKGIFGGRLFLANEINREIKGIAAG